MAPLENVNSNDVPIIGKEFFSAAYLMVDLDAATYTLWQVNDTTESRLVAVGGKCSEHLEVNSNENGTSATNWTTASPESTSRATKEKGISTGILVGIVVGSAVGASALAAIAVLYIMRRKRSALGKMACATELTATESRVYGMGGSGPPSYQDHGWGGPHGSAEVPGADMLPCELTGFCKPQELANRRTMRYELGS